MVDLAVPTRATSRRATAAAPGRRLRDELRRADGGGRRGGVVRPRPNGEPDRRQAGADRQRAAGGGWAGKSVSGGVLDLDAAVKLFAQRRGIALQSTPAPPRPRRRQRRHRCRTDEHDRVPGDAAPDGHLPRLRLHLSPTTFAVDARAHIAATRKRRVPAGATLTMTISEKGGVRLTIARRVTGRGSARTAWHRRHATAAARRARATTGQDAAVLKPRRRTQPARVQRPHRRPPARRRSLPDDRQGGRRGAERLQTAVPRLRGQLGCA